MGPPVDTCGPASWLALWTAHFAALIHCSDSEVIGIKETDRCQGGPCRFQDASEIQWDTTKNCSD